MDVRRVSSASAGEESRSMPSEATNRYCLDPRASGDDSGQEVEGPKAAQAEAKPKKQAVGGKVLLEDTEEQAGPSEAFGEIGGINNLLEGIAEFENKDPHTGEEREFLSNLFDSLCSALLLPENCSKFVESEGMELMLLILKQKRESRYGAAKVLEVATTQCLACHRFVDVLGLETLFPLFMDREKDQKTEAMLVTIIANLFQEIMKGSRRDRVAAKFVENEFEKCDRLIEIFFSYHDCLVSEKVRLEESLVLLMRKDYSKRERHNSVLSLFKQVCVIVGHLCCIEDAALKQKLRSLLQQRRQLLRSARDILMEMKDWQGLEKQRLFHWFNNLGRDERSQPLQQQQPQVLPDVSQQSGPNEENETKDGSRKQDSKPPSDGKESKRSKRRRSGGDDREAQEHKNKENNRCHYHREKKPRN